MFIHISSFYANRYGSPACTLETCEYLVTYHVTETEAQFELSGKGQWLAIGFSSDDKMVIGSFKIN